MGSWVSRTEIDFSCPICQDIFKNPVVLSCSHSFCKDCLRYWWTDKLIHECPVCKRKSSKSEPPSNLVLKNLCEAFLQELSLQEKASAESESHEQPACVASRDSTAHTNHRFRPVDEATRDHKEELRKTLKPLQDKLRKFNQVKVNWDQTTEQIKEQAQQTERQIREQFKKLHQFLQKEEESRITALRKEEEQKSHMMKQRIEALSKEIAALSETITATEKELRAADVSFLHNYKAALNRVQQHPLLDDPQLASGALIDVVKHLGNLTFNIWNKMRDTLFYFPMILDPNTAHPNLIVSEDLSSVIFREVKRELPQNPERFENYVKVLGSEGFNYGTHSWDVAVRNDIDWAVGVIESSVPRTGDILSGFSSLWFRDGKYRAHTPSVTDEVLFVEKPLQFIRMHLDWNRGKLSFFDLETYTHIYTFTETFTERLFPFVSTLNTKPLNILPVEVITKLEM
ncbi:zinc-binding protein A33-like [Scomber japonicus]|uniref:zinc-binding protein A33-like n=1 Tax=Scomber japonicus TaxID=13676 RepID=UPI002305E1D9|nr:zinc-binding protein A33-like [Scomber japonicus]